MKVEAKVVSIDANLPGMPVHTAYLHAATGLAGVLPTLTNINPDSAKDVQLSFNDLGLWVRKDGVTALIPAAGVKLVKFK